MQIVIFKLENEYFAVKTEGVQSINNIMNITKVPNAPKYIKGLINLRGSIKTLIDINLLLNIEQNKTQENIIILDINEEEVGIIVDKVLEVVSIENENLKGIESESYISGIINYEEKLITILDIDELIEFNLNDIV
ncbi:chemotaxis protein CheW [uncultured Clostridium sp.]|uniref:chemotaxis protein CheW n=1 Tax=uncultured Clostridium sp. TaxID=59620 RepID=UPI00261811E6|nr:chemotaxis protein CheW [uncultured Clostridium sp.]